ncbi:hypothetical protein SASPL_104631 [Salvia splendens]|uniref:Uncharacterized protein n=1 Tax=Salvia splendens TaxID=180675 RepID=A0A8X8YM13_SALSN|nr:hypothetical protein SASPL_104631 [Salvia splendens]
MEKKVAIVLSVILLIISANMVAVNSDASDCNDACTTACVNPDPRLTARCNTKCGIRCGPGISEVSGKISEVIRLDQSGSGFIA